MSLDIVDTGQTKPEDSLTVLGVRVDRLTQRETLEGIDRLVALRRESEEPIECQQVITVNTEFIIEAQHNQPFRQCINEAAMVVPDGMGVVWATRYLGKPAPERVTGTDTLPEVARLCARRGYRLYLLGAAPGVAESAAERLGVLAPGLQIAGTYAGSPAPEEEEAICECVRIAQADVLCVAYGAPAQELWIARNRSRLSVAVAMGVGGAYDFLSGRKPRAPKLMQNMGLEWLYRLYREPWRIWRMLAIPRFMILVLLKGRKTA
ncbi:WecB/TagA/CpsF family glycosyltransferase [Ktedonospora formicarum]|uniref:WecB/TagA/CpsF family glycosyl transferase n=1 Tax=Ktedonospora formicarum TaxID=2778364 RepID=A0A8J3HX70_9CHLR|nr:WecB/TagA/CpsF family glycosyltransferase [Ktedonospora formicarum]GHO43651.1 WecB/TagA/CpsF family glycosyl transferase [Ktedonospora formicarum]